MERNERGLEAQSDKNQRDSRHEDRHRRQRSRRSRRLRQQLRDRAQVRERVPNLDVELRGRQPDRTVDQCDSVEQETGGERAEQKVLDGRLFRLALASRESRQNVQRDRKNFQSDKEVYEVGALGHHHRPGRRKENERAELTGGQVLLFQVTTGHQQAEKRRDAQNQVAPNAEAIDDDSPTPVQRRAIQKRLNARSRQPPQRDQMFQRDEEAADHTGVAYGRDQFLKRRSAVGHVAKKRCDRSGDQEKRRPQRNRAGSDGFGNHFVHRLPSRPTLAGTTCGIRTASGTIAVSIVNMSGVG